MVLNKCFITIMNIYIYMCVCVCVKYQYCEMKLSCKIRWTMEMNVIKNDNAPVNGTLIRVLMLLYSFNADL